MYSRYPGIPVMPLALLICVWSAVASAATAPVAYDQTVDINDGGGAITLCAIGGEGDFLEYEVLDEPTSGDLFGAPPELTYFPGMSFMGSDSFTFRASNGLLDSNTATVTINAGGGSPPLSGLMSCPLLHSLKYSGAFGDLYASLFR